MLLPYYQSEGILIGFVVNLVKKANELGWIVRASHNLNRLLDKPVFTVWYEYRY